jgi:hypothetical protein
MSGAELIRFTGNKMYQVSVEITVLESIDDSWDKKGWLEGIVPLLGGLSRDIEEGGGVEGCW